MLNYSDSDEDCDSDISEEYQSSYVLGICELFNKQIHGFIEDQSSPSIYYHYFMRNDFKIQTFYKRFTIIENSCQRLNNYYKNVVYYNHPIYYVDHSIQNYKKIIQGNIYEYIKPEIIERIILPIGGECIAIKKTIWLKLIQRTWKKVYSQQKDVMNKRKSLHSIRYREIHGLWPNHCLYYPTIKGMLSYLLIKKS
jgi:hypothetical protein